VHEKSLGMRPLRVFRARARQSRPPSSAAGVARNGKDEKTFTNGSGWMYNRYWARMATRESWFERACCGHMTEEAAWCFRPSVRGTVQGASMDRSFVLTLGCWLWASVAVAQPKTKDYDLATASISGDVLRGPRRITAHNLNVLRYDYRFKGAISFTQAADLWSRLTSRAAPAPAGPPPAAPSPGASRSVNCEADVRAEGE
jgi:hypothetical protein